MRKSFAKRLKYQAGDLLATFVLDLAVRGLRGIPQKHVATASKVTGRLASVLLKRYRERILTHLSMAFGKEKDGKEIQDLMREIFYHLAFTGFETVYGLANPVEVFREFQIEGKDNLDDALAGGNGVIVVGAHLGSFPLLGGRLGTKGYKINTLIDMDHFPKLWSRINQRERQHGENPIPAKPAFLSIKKSIDCLRRNEVLNIIADQQQRRGGIPVPFFGRTAFTPPGPAFLSLKTGAPLLPMFAVREDAIRRRLIIKEPIRPQGTSDEQKEIEVLTARMTQVIEDAVREYPSQWAWINRRWKLPPENLRKHKQPPSECPCPRPLDSEKIKV
jgi:Kdo2-lipid IVA lauroyltransferase/acyltransferase